MTERLFLILEFLHGRKHAQQIIADMLEDEGNKYLADRVRSRKQGGRKLLQLALEVIPFQMGVGVGLEFFKHAISFAQPVADFDSAFQLMKNWIDEVKLEPDESNDAFDIGCDAVLDVLTSINYREVCQRMTNGPRQGLRAIHSPGFSNFEQALLSLLETLVAGKAILVAERTGDFSKAKRSNNRLRNALIKCATNCRELPEPLTRHLRPQDLRPYENLVQHSALHGQLDWQWNHLIQTIQVRIG